MNIFVKDVMTVKVISVEVKQVDLPEQMLRAMAKQAEAAREARAKEEVPVGAVLVPSVIVSVAPPLVDVVK